MNSHFIDLKFSKNISNYYFVISSVFYSLFLLIITSGLKILSPVETNWLSLGDGTSELSWEFFRREPFLQFPIGKNPNYGLEISSSIAFDGQIPIMSLIFKPFTSFIPDRFQYFGIFLFLTFAFNYYFACKIFQHLNLSFPQILLNSLLLSSTPVILNRFIENTHYALTSAWLIFWAILLALSNNNIFKSWLVLFNLIPLIHFYFMPFIVLIYILSNANLIIRKQLNLIPFLLHSFFIFISTVLTMILIGYFYNQSSSQDVGFGIYRSTLTSLFDSSGWSIIIPDIKETSGAYEGFSFVGINGIILIFMYIFTRFLQNQQKSKRNQSFKILWLSAILLYIFSLSNKIAFGDFELLEYPIPKYFDIIANSFRSTGRFSWLLVFVLFIYLSFKISLKLPSRVYSVFLTLLVSIFFIDSGNHLRSQKEIKFNYVHKTSLIDSAWSDISKCYKNIRFFPPVASIDNLYNFLLVANSQNLGINSARFARFNQLIQNKEIIELEKMIEYGSYDRDSFYVFNTSPFVDDNLVKLYKELSIRTLNDNDGWGIIDNYQFIAPELINCKSKNNLMNKVIAFGTDGKYLYKGEDLFFGTGQNNDKYNLLGFSEISETGVKVNLQNSRIIINTEKDFVTSEIQLGVSRINNQEKIQNIYISINNSKPIICVNNKNLYYCSIKNIKKFNDNLINIRFENLSDQFFLTSLLIN